MNNFGKIIIEWYREHKRELPWRNTSDPYKIWISEIILQQTRVAQGYDYFVRFIRRFPDVFALAKASEDEVLKYWQGLGYYSRARNLHEAAKKIAVGGSFPDTYREIRALKGVGDYTAAAICSFAYNLPYATVDGNVYRVLSRWLGIEEPIDSTGGKKIFAAAAEDLLDRKQPGLYNQALMEFGALQCTPQNPNCLFCPLAESCSALQKGWVNRLPVKQHKTVTVNRYFNYIYVRMGAYTFLKKRENNDIWKNLFELPLIETDSDLPEEELLASPAFQSLFVKGEIPLSIRCVKRGVKHVLSHRILYTNFYEITLPETSVSFSAYRKVKYEEIEQYAVPRLIHQFFEDFERSK